MLQCCRGPLLLGLQPLITSQSQDFCACCHSMLQATAVGLLLVQRTRNAFSGLTN